MESIILFGGAFNPVHIEHIRLAEAAVKLLQPTKLIVMPTFLSPHKSGSIQATCRQRLEMCRLAFASVPRTEVSSYEIDQGTTSYSYLTCEWLKETYPQAKLYFLMGADMVSTFHEWREPERILACCEIVACAREGSATFDEACQRFVDRYGNRLSKLTYQGGNVSSTVVRALSFGGESVDGLVSESVNAYLQQHHIYQNGLALRVKNELCGKDHVKRWQHTVRVAKMMALNRKRIGWNEEDALLAGYLHDQAKYMSLTDERLEGFELPDGVPSPVVHQYTGAFLAQKQGCDLSVVQAIRYHTSGRPAMSKEEMLLFLCDMLEEGRNYAEVEPLRSIFAQDIEGCLKTALTYQIAYLQGTQTKIYPLTQQAFEYYTRK